MFTRETKLNRKKSPYFICWEERQARVFIYGDLEDQDHQN